MSTPEYQPPDKNALLAVIARERANLEELIAPLSEHQMMEAGVEGQWSIKDILAHISTWERLAHDRLQAGLTGSSLKFPLITSDEFVDQFNAEIFQANREKSFSEIKVEFEEAHARLLSLIEDLPPEVLRQKLPFEWAGKLTYQLIISSNTHWHYIEHADSIEQWLLTQDD